MTAVAVLRAFVAWLHKWGAWLVSLIFAVVVFFFRRRLTPPGLSPVVQKAEKVASEAEQNAVEAAKAEKQAATAAHERDLAAVVDSERQKGAQIADDPEEVNTYLREAGDSVKRGEK